jgi:hypothetical protein
MPAHLYSPFATHSAIASRQHPRAPFSVPITLHHLSMGGIRSTRGISLDIGEGGLGALTEGALHVGETVAIDFRLSDQPITTVAIVRHTCSVCSSFEFVGLTPEERSQIGNIVGHS